jgi:broad specificity phosphatase PhoE
MIAAVVRHAKVDMKWSFMQTSAGYDRECEMYDAAPVLPVTVKIPEADFKKFYVSRLPRTAATARQVVGDRKLTATALINEVPERSGFDTGLKLPRFLQSGVSRAQWLLCSRRQPETRIETRQRAEKFVEHLIRKNEDCVVFTHGFFMITLLQVMKERGFHADHTRLAYANGECVVCEREETADAGAAEIGGERI